MMIKRCRPRETVLVASILFGGLFLATTSGSAQNWPRFRGPNGSGVSDATTVPTKWSDSDYNWRIDLPGVGHSSPVVWDDLLVATCGIEKDATRIILGFDANTGEQRWRKDFKSETHRKHKLNSFASATPALDAEGIYTCFASPESFRVVALDHRGSERWRVDLGEFKAGHGGGVSLIVHDDLVIVPKQHEGDSEIIALNRSTGEAVWRVARKSRSTWATPCVFRNAVGNAELIVVSYEHGITSLDPASGELNWEVDVFDKGHFESTIGSPVIAGDLVLGMSGYLSVRQEVIAVRPGNGKAIGKPIYTLDRGAPLCTTPLVVGDLLYMWSDGGIVTCANAQTGKIHWRERLGGTYYASPVAVNGYIYGVSAAGKVVVLAAGERYRLVSRTELGEVSHSTPAVANGVMYLRTLSKLFSLGGDKDGA